MKKIKFKLPTLEGLVKQVAKTKKLPWILAEHTFLTFLFFFFLILVLSGFIFYKYSILVEKKEPEVLEKTFQFEEETYREILKKWQENEQRFEEASKKKCLDPFRLAEEEKKETEDALENDKNQEEKPEEKPETFVHTIIKGATLWEIAEQFLGSGLRWQEIKKEDGEIFTEGAAYYLQPGQKVVIPPE